MLRCTRPWEAGSRVGGVALGGGVAAAVCTEAGEEAAPQTMMLKSG